jgi:hypothetical protein
VLGIQASASNPYRSNWPTFIWYCLTFYVDHSFLDCFVS